jgi:dynein heavy chain 2
MRDVGAIEKFTSESTETLSRQPQTIEEIGEANVRHAEIMKTSPEVIFFFVTYLQRIFLS